jgi:hypothetical protein
MNKAVKTRDQSILEFFETLQIEYFICEVRRKIYPAKSDKSYYEKLMAYKKSRILDIAERNKFPTIFDDEETKRYYRGLVYPDEGLPKFPMSAKDLHNYYLPTTGVRFYEGKVKTGKIISANFDNNTVIVKVRTEPGERLFLFKQVTRIL